MVAPVTIGISRPIVAASGIFFNEHQRVRNPYFQPNIILPQIRCEVLAKVIYDGNYGRP
jgi:hypothetical protein